ncbi:hypothetical protein IIV22_151R [Invertebrate iridescent virus 22]|uniref:Uncharacterized protein n=1 Tax=Invertebrate iridescent virus 22 TaxID=345198 RepID=S6DA95_9VIRU|nr:hypothetical protein IIV22_151R [Invertebrate iridescent virus 22]CCV01828.1 hypothetical protein IIV22_151R [Invertebrate iridescent virus 22]
MKTITNLVSAPAVVGVKNKMLSTVLATKNSKNQLLISILRERLFYLSHPSVSNLECSVNLSITNMCSPKGFEETIKDVLSLANFNPKEIEINHKVSSIIFKDVAAIKLLNILFKDYSNHPLHPIYLKWIQGSEWMTQFT